MAAGADRPRVAVAACEQFPDLHDDWPLLRAALGQAGIDGRAAVWSDPDEDWSAFDLIVANGVWDNIHRADEFLDWADRIGIGLGVPMVNSPASLFWNIDKRYLRDLDARGVPIVPTTWVEPGGATDGIRMPVPGYDGAEVVVKPSISGGGHLTARYGRDDEHDVTAHVRSLTERGRTAMVQPYVATVDRDGETGLIFLGGAFSHAIHKAPMIRPCAGPRDSLIDNQVTTEARATPAQLELGQRAVAAAEDLVGPTAYARVDMVTLDDGTHALLELELLDPVLFFVHHPAGAAAFARVISEHLAAL